MVNQRNSNNADLSLNGDIFINSLNRSLPKSAKKLFGGGMPCQDVIFSFSNGLTADCEIRYKYLSNNYIHQLLMYVFTRLYVMLSIHKY